MKRFYSIPMLGIAAMLASCNVDEPAIAEVDDLVPVTISASIPGAGQMTTRAAAADDVAATNCYVQILAGADNSELSGGESAVRAMTNAGNGQFNLTVMLNPTATYTFLFWADNVTTAAPATLTNVAYNTDGNTIAFADKLENQSWSTTGITATLNHVVTRVTVRTTSNTTIDTRTLTVTVPTAYSAYNVLTEQPSSAANLSFTNFSSANGDPGSPAQMGFFYVLCADATQNITLQYSGYLGNPAVTISSAPLRPNYHVVLQGDVANAGLAQGTISATVDSNWTDSQQTF